jgi:hypothetical protein
MRFLCAAFLVCFLVGCGKVGEGSDDRARAVDPVMKTTPVASASDADPAKIPGSTRVANAPPDPVSAPAGAKPAPTPASPVEVIINKYVDSGVDGVVDVRTDKSGAITKVIVVGATPISTVLGAADGLLTARREARLRAAGKFRQFLKEKVSVEEKSETERIVKLESEKGSDLTESGKKISKFTDKYETISEGMVKGLQVLGYKTVSLNAKEKVYVMVCGWDAVTSKAAGNLADELDKDMNAKGGQGGGSPEERRKLEDQHNVTPAGSKFFDTPPSDKPPSDKPPSDTPRP